MMKVIVIIALFGNSFLMAQVSEKKDTSEIFSTLQQVIITGDRPKSHIVLNKDELKNRFLITGKKQAVIDITNLNSNDAQKIGRQLFARIPGAFVYDMDGSGNQLNISTRGLEPHRSWEYNVRQNLVLTNSDMYGYPASHYSAPIESIGQVEIISGTASLQYGAQFGGLINYTTKNADTSKPLSYEGINTVGSWGLLSTHHAAGGKSGKLTYYGYLNFRKQDGYRDIAYSKAHAQYASLQYDASKSWMFKAEFSHSQYQYRMPGPLTDAMFTNHPRQATRERNWYSPNIFVPAITIRYQPSAKTSFYFVSSAVLGSRNSVMFLAFANVPDTINPITNDYKARQVDIDNFNSYTQELKLKQHYTLLGKPSILSAGVQVMTNRMLRRQQGKGTTGSDFDLTIDASGWGRDLSFTTKNIALYAENSWAITPQWSVSPGIRFEKGNSQMDGYIRYYAEEKVPLRIDHSFPLFGVSTQFLFNEQRIYAGIAQAYRPIIFKDIIPASTLEQIDPNLTDASGYTAEVGISGHFKHQLTYDVSGFFIQYNNRLGGILKQLPDGSSYMYKTNLGDSYTTGLEWTADWMVYKSKNRLQVSIFSAGSFMIGRYTNGNVVVNHKNISLAGKTIESVPEWISRSGVHAKYNRLSLSLQYSYVSSSFSDALNTTKPSPNGAQGIVPAYSLFDINFAFRINKHIQLKSGINNIFNASYFTKRPQFYPEPGIWASDGQSFYGTVCINL